MSRPAPGPALREAVTRAAAELSQAQAGAYEAFALRTRSPLAAEVLAERAGVRTGRPDRAWGPHWARAVALGAEDDALARGVAAFEQLGVEPTTLPREAATVWAQTWLRAGRHGELRAHLDGLDLADTDRWALRTDLANPFLGAANADPDHQQVVQWCALLSEPFVADGLEGVSLDPAGPRGPDDTPYRRLRSVPTSATGGDLVTVVMSAYSPDTDLVLAVRSVLDQSWQDLELLIVDDASPPGSEELLEQAAGLDERVRVVRAPRNGGTYLARNLALAEARGRWMTFQDSDDWTHPRRLEAQVRSLQEDPALLACRSWTLRAYPDLSLTFVGYPPDRLNASSLLFEREPVQRLLGGFDAVRKSADMELPQRLKAVRRGSVRDLRHPAPLAITQLRSGSLSRTDAVPGWTRWTRIAYRDAYLEWHDRISAGRADAVAGDPATPRPFPLPDPTWAPDRPSPTRELDVVVLGDLRSQQPTSRRTLSTALLAASRGLRTGLAAAETARPLAPKRQPLLGEAMTAINAGRLVQTHVSAPDRARTLVVTDPEAVLHLPAGAPSLQVEEVVLVPAQDAGEGWTREAVDERIAELFGLRPRWVAGLPNAVAADEWQVWRSPVPAQGRPLVLGHHLPDRPARWPRTAGQVLAAAPDDPDLDHRFLAGVKVPSRKLGSELPPPWWLTLVGTGTTPREFLGQLDVLVYHGEMDAEGEVAVLEALASGLPCVLAESSGAQALLASAGSRLDRAVRLVPAAGTARAARELASSFGPEDRHDVRAVLTDRATAWEVVWPTPTPHRGTSDA